WLILLPLDSLIAGAPEGMESEAAAKWLWSRHIRFIGIGAMLVGGLWTLTQLRKPISESFTALRAAYQDRRAGGHPAQARSLIPRTERDAPLPWIIGPFVLSLLPMAWIYHQVVGNAPVAVGMTLVMAVAAFLFSAVAAYMAGLVGSSSNPVSGVTIATIMLAGLMLVVVMGRGNPAGPAAT